MARRWTEFGVAFILLGAMLGVNQNTLAQERAFDTAPAKDVDGTGTSNTESNTPASSVDPAPVSDVHENSVGLRLIENIAEDQKALWIGPKSLRFTDADWLVPLGGAAAAMFVTDTGYSKHLSNSPNRIKYSKDLSNYGIASMVGIGGGLYLLGHVTHDDHKIETGILAGEAAIDSLVPVYAMKYGLGRERPSQNYNGNFFSGGQSFPSEHAAAAWAIASVVAHEYPGPLTSLFAYGLASAVSASRITAKEHFPSDVLIGSAIGWLEGMYVYRKHHDTTLGGGDWETYAEAHDSSELSAGDLGSPYVPLDSWIYPAMERLAGLGLINEGFLGMRPWTRRECARLIGDAADELSNRGDANTEASALIDALQREFRPDSEAAANRDGGAAFRLESVYSRTEHISGIPLTDGYTFAQTQFNDFGRPYGEGWSTVNGFSSYATWGHWVGYVRGEEQSAPSIPSLSLPTREVVQTVDGYPQLPPGTAQSAVNQLSLLDAYVGVTWSNWQFSFGQQSLWWGPGDGSSLMLSNNVQPINMFRINRISPFQLPSILKFLGPMRLEFFVGQLTGQRFLETPNGPIGSWTQPLEPQPFIHGQKLSFHPTRNVEIGLSRTTIFAGAGTPFTTHTFGRSLFNVGHYTGAPGDFSYPGDRLSGLDFTYRIPKLRNWLSVYADGYANDQIIFAPTGYPDRAIWIAGTYLAKFPGISKLDLRAEGGYTNSPIGSFYDTGYYYGNEHYLSGYTNGGNIIGSWMGRGAQGEQVWSNYWFNARDRLQFNFRQEKIGAKFLPGGGSLTDIGVRGDYWVHASLGLSVSVQHERWLIPVIQPNAERDVAASVEIMFAPQKVFRRSPFGLNDADFENGGQP